MGGVVVGVGAVVLVRQREGAVASVEKGIRASTRLNRRHNKGKNNLYHRTTTSNGKKRVRANPLVSL